MVAEELLVSSSVWEAHCPLCHCCLILLIRVVVAVEWHRYYFYSESSSVGAVVSLANHSVYPNHVEQHIALGLMMMMIVLIRCLLRKHNFPTFVDSSIGCYRHRCCYRPLPV